MRKTIATLIILECFLAVVASVLCAQAQKDDGLVLQPHRQTVAKKPAASTLRVSCDIACKWTLDGVAHGLIPSDGSGTAAVSREQHLLIVSSTDGLDSVKKQIDVTVAGQTVVLIELRPVRAERLHEEQAQQTEGQPHVQPVETRPRMQEQTGVRDQQQAAREQAESAPAVWTDPTTRLMWTLRDNGEDVNWSYARDYCHTLRLAGYSDWRLPQIGELEHIYSADVSEPDYQLGLAIQNHVRGHLQLSGHAWSDTVGESWGQSKIFNFHDSHANSFSVLRTESTGGRALCLR